MGRRKITLGFINLVTRAVNKRGERRVRAIYGRKKGLNFFSHGYVSIEIYERCFIQVNIYYSEGCGTSCWVDVAKDSV